MTSATTEQPKTGDRHPGGRPSDYTQELADQICSQLSEGLSLRTVCLAPDMPDKSTVFRWLREHPEFQDHYARAKEEAADAMAEDILDIADNGTNDLMTIKRGKEEVEVPNREVIERSKLRVDTRKWYMSKVKPKKYGDKLDLSTLGKELPVPILSGASVGPRREPPKPAPTGAPAATKTPTKPVPPPTATPPPISPGTGRPIQPAAQANGQPPTAPPKTPPPKTAAATPDDHPRPSGNLGKALEVTKPETKAKNETDRNN